MVAEIPYQETEIWCNTGGKKKNPEELQQKAWKMIKNHAIKKPSDHWKLHRREFDYVKDKQTEEWAAFENVLEQPTHEWDCTVFITADYVVINRIVILSINIYIYFFKCQIKLTKKYSFYDNKRKNTYQAVMSKFCVFLLEIIPIIKIDAKSIRWFDVPALYYISDWLHVWFIK